MESCWWIVRGDEDAKDARIGLGLLAKSFLGRRTKAQVSHLGFVQTEQWSVDNKTTTRTGGGAGGSLIRLLIIVRIRK